MATTLDQFAKEVQLQASEDPLVESGSTEKKFLGAIQIFNTYSTSVEVTLWLIDSATAGTTGSGGNQSIIKTIASNSSLRLMDFSGQVVDNSMKLSGMASVANVVNIRISGTTER